MWEINWYSFGLGVLAALWMVVVVWVIFLAVNFWQCQRFAQADAALRKEIRANCADVSDAIFTEEKPR